MCDELLIRSSSGEYTVKRFRARELDSILDGLWSDDCFYIIDRKVADLHLSMLESIGFTSCQAVYVEAI